MICHKCANSDLSQVQVPIFHLSFFKASVFCTATGVSRADVVSKWGKQQLSCKNAIERWPFSFYVLRYSDAPLKNSTKATCRVCIYEYLCVFDVQFPCEKVSLQTMATCRVFISVCSMYVLLCISGIIKMWQRGSAARRKCKPPGERQGLWSL